MIDKDPYFLSHIWQQTKLDRWILKKHGLKRLLWGSEACIVFSWVPFLFLCKRQYKPPKFLPFVFYNTEHLCWNLPTGDGGAPASTCGVVAGGPYFSFDSGLIFQPLQQLPHTQTLGYPSLPQWERAGFSHVSPPLVRQNVGEVKRGIWLLITTSTETSLIPGLTCRISIHIRCC